MRMSRPFESQGDAPQVFLLQGHLVSRDDELQRSQADSSVWIPSELTIICRSVNWMEDVQPDGLLATRVPKRSRLFQEKQQLSTVEDVRGPD